MAPEERNFLFDSLGAKRPRTSRKAHIRLLYDVLQLAIQRGDYTRARRAWSILIRCKEIDWKAMWKTGVLLVDDIQAGYSLVKSRKLEYLSAMMLQCPEERQAIFQELVLRYILGGHYDRALDELELYMPSQPYAANPILHIYAGLICLYLAQPKADATSNWNTISIRKAQMYLERAKALDQDNVVASAWIALIPSLFKQELADASKENQESDGDDEVVQISSQGHRAKRSRT